MRIVKNKLFRKIILYESGQIKILDDSLEIEFETEITFTILYINKYIEF